MAVAVEEEKALRGEEGGVARLREGQFVKVEEEGCKFPMWDLVLFFLVELCCR